jgi:hypothetical protein
MDFSDEQFTKVSSSISASCDPGSNVTIESDEQPQKDSRPRMLTEPGMQIEHSDVQEQNASLQISFKCDTGTNVMTER